MTDALALLSPASALPESATARRRLCLLACGEGWPLECTRALFAQCAPNDQAALLASLAKAHLSRSGAVGIALASAVDASRAEGTSSARIALLSAHATAAELAMAAARAGAQGGSAAVQALIDGAAASHRHALLSCVLQSAAACNQEELATSAALALALDCTGVAGDDEDAPEAAARALESACLCGHASIARMVLRTFPHVSRTARMQGAKLATARGHGDLARLVLAAPNGQQVIAAMAASAAMDLSTPAHGADEALRPAALARMASLGRQVPQALSRAVSSGDARGARALAHASSEIEVQEALVQAAGQGDAAVMGVMARHIARSPVLPATLSRAMEVAAKNGSEAAIARLLASRPHGDGQGAVEAAVAAGKLGALDLLLSRLPPRTDAQLARCLRKCVELGNPSAAQVIASHADQARVSALARELLMASARCDDDKGVQVAAALLGEQAKGTGHAAMLEAERRGNAAAVGALKRTLLLHRAQSTPTQAAMGLLSLDDTMLGYTLEFLCCADVGAANQTCRRVRQRTRVLQQTETCLVQDYLAARSLNGRALGAPPELDRLAVVVSSHAAHVAREIACKASALQRILALGTAQRWPDQSAIAVQLCASAARADNAKVAQTLLEHRAPDGEWCVLAPAAHLIFGVAVDHVSMHVLAVLLRVCLADGRLGTRPLVARVRHAAGTGQSGLVGVLLAALSREATASRRAAVELAHRRREEWLQRGGLIMVGAAPFDDGLANRTTAETDLDDAFAGALVHAAEAGRAGGVKFVLAMLRARGRLGDFAGALGAATEAAARVDGAAVVALLLAECRDQLTEEGLKATLMIAARNEFAATASVLVDGGAVPAIDVAFLFVEAARRGWAHAVRCLLATGCIALVTVEVALEEATRRGADEITAALAAAKASMEAASGSV